MHVLIVGAGNMSLEYAKVLRALSINFSVIGRGEDKSSIFVRETGTQVLTGGLEVAFRKLKVLPTHAIIATTIESLTDNALFLLENDVKKILIEKPAAVNKEGLYHIAELAAKKKADCYIAYNRRFYSSVIEAGKLIEEDGGIKSFLFEFSEWSHTITNKNKTQFQLNNWFISNSTHVLDTAFYFGGLPREMKTFVKSELSWHPKGSIYTGSGITERGILFSYHANWGAPGSWKLELLTNNYRYIFRPFEKLHVQKIGTVTVEEVKIDYSLDTQFKPGLYRQTRAFLVLDSDAVSKRLLTVEEGWKYMKIYEQIHN